MTTALAVYGALLSTTLAVARLLVRAVPALSPSRGAGAERAAALDHEVGDDAVEGEAVVEAVGGELAKVLDRLWGDVTKAWKPGATPPDWAGEVRT